MEKGCKSTEYCRATFVALSGYFNVLEHQREVKDTQLSTAPVFGDLIEMLRREAHVSRLQIAALLMQCPAIFGDLSDELRTDNNLATSLLEGLALAGNSVF